MTSESPTARKARFRFSLRHMLVLTAIIAVWTAVLLAVRANARLTQRRNDLLALSSRLEVTDPDQLQSVEYPSVAKDMETWEVHVPDGKPYELRFSVATVSEAGMPEEYEKLPLAPGRHRITLHTADHADEDYRFTVFLDGQSVVEKTMGRQWMPDGWRQAGGVNAPEGLRDNAPSMLHLGGEAYTPRTKFESGSYFNGQSDGWVTRLGYRIWIDQADQTYPALSPFIGFAGEPDYYGIGFRDGLRYRATQGKQYAWTFTRIASQSNKPVLTIVPEFFVGDQMVLSDQTVEFGWWKWGNESQGYKPSSIQADPENSAYSLLLRADIEAADAIKPVVELRWEASRPNDVGIRLPNLPANKDLTKWRIRITGGTSHLWRLLDVGDQQLDVRTNLGDTADPSSSAPLPIELEPQSGDPYALRWRTDVARPLQMLERDKISGNAYRGMTLFRGMPVAFEAELVASLKPQLKIVPAANHPDKPNTVLPGGPVIDELQIELDATSEDFIWLRTVPRNASNAQKFENVRILGDKTEAADK